MSVEDPKDLDRVDQDIRINELKERANELAGGKMASGSSPDIPPDVEEAFWRRVVEYESAAMTTNLEQLKRLGIDVPPPETLDDEALSKKLREVIDGLARWRNFLQCTDHLSDRDLYKRLYAESLREEVEDVPLDEIGPGAWIIDLVGTGGEPDTRDWLAYYADDKTRAHWMKDFPDYDLPPRAKLPCDRDRRLPKSGLPGLDRPSDE